MRLEPRQPRTLVLLGVVVLALHGAGFLLLVPVASAAGASGVVSSTRRGEGGHACRRDRRDSLRPRAAPRLGRRYISAIDNATRKLMADGQRPVSTGFFSSLGHSSVVFAPGFLSAIGILSAGGRITTRTSALHGLGNWLGTGISGSFLYLGGDPAGIESRPPGSKRDTCRSA